MKPLNETQVRTKNDPCIKLGHALVFLLDADHHEFFVLVLSPRNQKGRGLYIFASFLLLNTTLFWQCSPVATFIESTAWTILAWPKISSGLVGSSISYPVYPLIYPSRWLPLYHGWRLRYF